MLGDKGEDADKFRGIIITRTDSSLQTIEDLKGKKIDVAKECIVEEAPENKQENLILAVDIGEVDAGFIRQQEYTNRTKRSPADCPSQTEQRG